MWLKLHPPPWTWVVLIESVQWHLVSGEYHHASGFQFGVRIVENILQGFHCVTRIHLKSSIECWVYRTPLSPYNLDCAVRNIGPFVSFQRSVGTTHVHKVRIITKCTNRILFRCILYNVEQIVSIIVILWNVSFWTSAGSAVAAL